MLLLILKFNRSISLIQQIFSTINMADVEERIKAFLSRNKNKPTSPILITESSSGENFEFDRSTLTNEHSFFSKEAN